MNQQEFDYIVIGGGGQAVFWLDAYRKIQM